MTRAIIGKICGTIVTIIGLVLIIMSFVGCGAKVITIDCHDGDYHDYQYELTVTMDRSKGQMYYWRHIENNDYELVCFMDVDGDETIIGRYRFE